MSNNIYVGNLNYDTTEDGLREFFAAHGQVTSVRVITDRQTGRPRGFGFVEMATEEQAQSAIAALNGQTLDGRQLRVDEARPRRPRSDFGGGYSRDRW
jgi:RNA recognition motif-containing protein